MKKNHFNLTFNSADIAKLSAKIVNDCCGNVSGGNMSTARHLYHLHQTRFLSLDIHQYACRIPLGGAQPHNLIPHFFSFFGRYIRSLERPLKGAIISLTHWNSSQLITENFLLSF